MTSHDLTWQHMTSPDNTWHHLTSHDITWPHTIAHHIKGDLKWPTHRYVYFIPCNPSKVTWQYGSENPQVPQALSPQHSITLQGGSDHRPLISFPVHAGNRDGQNSKQLIVGIEVLGFMSQSTSGCYSYTFLSQLKSLLISICGSSSIYDDRFSIWWLRTACFNCK